MQIVYGQGTFSEAGRIFKGAIVLEEHKLLIRSPEGDIAQTYIPLEKVENIKVTANQAHIFVRPGVSYYYTAVIQGERQKIRELSKELVRRRGFKKKFLRNEWFEVKA